MDDEAYIEPVGECARGSTSAVVEYRDHEGKLLCVLEPARGLLRIQRRNVRYIIDLWSATMTEECPHAPAPP